MKTSRKKIDDIYLDLNFPVPDAPLAHSEDRPVSWEQMMDDIEFFLSITNIPRTQTEKMPDFEPFVLD